MTTRTDPHQRNCYCGLWDTSPETLLEQGLPNGFCGTCQTCGRPGHTRHFPGSSPSTGAWCDRHYRRTAWLHPLGIYGGYVWFTVVAVVIIAWVLLSR